MRYAIVNDNNEVENIVEWNGQDDYSPDGTLVRLGIDSLVQVGWTYENNEFIEPNPETGDEHTVDTD